MSPARFAVTAALCALTGLPVRAQSSASTVFVPDQPPASTARGRSAERERTPAAWGISDKQWERFQYFAESANRPLSVVIRLNNQRSRQFKDDLTELLQSIPGWDVNDQGEYTAGSLPSFDGILIQNRSAVDPGDDALLIKQALDAAGIQPTAQFDATQPMRIRIVIGAPPDSP